MKTQDKFYLVGLSLVFVLSGCVVRTYPITRERVEVTAGKSFPIVGYKEQSKTFESQDPIEPGINRWLIQVFSLPATNSGFSLTGNYDVTITVYANNKFVEIWRGKVYLTT